MDHASIRAPTAAPPGKANIAVKERLVESPGVPAIANLGITLLPIPVGGKDATQAEETYRGGFIYRSCTCPFCRLGV